MDGELGGAGDGEGLAGGVGGGRPGGDRVVAEDVAVEAAADLGDRRAHQQFGHPELLAGEVVDQVADAPVGARGGRVPLVGGDQPDPFGEGGEGLGVRGAPVGRPPVFVAMCHVLSVPRRALPYAGLHHL